MLSIPQQVKIFVALQPTDMRRGFPGLSGEVQSTLQQDPLSGHLFLFHNRRRDRIKVLFWDGDGYAIYYKQLARGTFEFPTPADHDSSAVQRRLESLSLPGPPDKLVTYSDVIDERGGMRASPRQVRRNAPCPCGSGLKFKRCCGRRSPVAD